MLLGCMRAAIYYFFSPHLVHLRERLVVGNNRVFLDDVRTVVGRF